jgi:metabolite-proton symporter
MKKVEPAQDADTARRNVAASVIGTSLEWYDFFIYSAAAAVLFDRIFFPKIDPYVATLLSLGTFSVGFVARPLGSIFFGHLGDRVGRKQILVVTLLLTGGATAVIGLLPTYSTIGLAAPLLLVSLRFVQGLGLGGEWAGAVLMVWETSKPSQRGFYSSLPQLGVPLGNLLATGALASVAATMDDGAFLQWGWRIPFLFGGALVLIGLWIRLKLSETKEFVEAQRTSKAKSIPLFDVFRNHKRSLLIAFGARIGNDVAFYTFTVFVLIYVTTVLKLPRSVGLSAVLIASTCQIVFIPALGALSDRIGRRKVYLFGAIGAALWVFAFFPLLDTGSSLWITVAVVAALVFHAGMYAPQAALLAELFPTEVRYTGASLGYQLATLFGGAITPLASFALLNSTASSVSVSIYVAVMLLWTITTIVAAPETAWRDENTGFSPANSESSTSRASCAPAEMPLSMGSEQN